MKLEHFGMAEPGDCRLVFTASAEELAAALAKEAGCPGCPAGRGRAADGSGEPHHSGGL